MGNARNKKKTLKKEWNNRAKKARTARQHKKLQNAELMSTSAENISTLLYTSNVLVDCEANDTNINEDCSVNCALNDNELLVITGIDENYNFGLHENEKSNVFEIDQSIPNSDINKSNSLNCMKNLSSSEKEQLNERVNSRKSELINGSVLACNNEDLQKELDSMEMQSITKIQNTNAGFLDKMGITGRKIVDVIHFLESFVNLFKKHGTSCDKIQMQGTKFVNEGLGTRFLFQCANCDFSSWIYSEKKKKRGMPVNQLSALSSLTVGIGYEGCNQFFAGMGISFMTDNTYREQRTKLLPFVEQASKDVMHKAAEEEKEIAISEGRVINGIAHIAVEGDGGYGKRSYKSGRFNSLCGVAVLLGAKTKKVLSIGVRNKYCFVCLMAAKKNQNPKPHRCFKNFKFSDSSSAMETDAILESFKNSVDTHGLIYKTFIADGDASTYSAIQANDVYRKQGVQVERLYCTNHLFRNLCNKIQTASQIPLPRTRIAGKITTFRDYIKASALKFRRHIESQIKKRQSNDCSKEEKIKELRLDIFNAMNHIFGCHKKCKTRDLDCSKYKGTKNFIPMIEETPVYRPIDIALKKISLFSKSLIEGVTTNAAENFMSIMAKVTGGKRTFLAARDSYYQRSNLAVIQCNTGNVLSTMAQYLGEDSSIARKIENQMSIKRVRNTERRKSSKGTRKNLKFYDDDKYYGNNHQEVDVSPEEYEQLKEVHFDKLNDDQLNRLEIEKKTVEQSDNEKWHELRRKLLLASKFGRVCRLQKNTFRATAVEEILYPVQLDLEQFDYDLRSEGKARDFLRKKLKVNVEQGGLCIDEKHSFLAASLDGKIELNGEKGVVRYYSPHFAQNFTPKKAIEEFTDIRNIYDSNDLKKMNKKHDYYFHIQGQMRTSNRSFCIFVLYTPKGIYNVREDYNQEFWGKKMEKKLENFYNDCLLPEILNPRFSRNMPIREPQYILDAKKKTEENELKRKSETVKNTKTPAKKSKISKGKIDVTIDADNGTLPKINDIVEKVPPPLPHAAVDKVVQIKNKIPPNWKSCKSNFENNRQNFKFQRNYEHMIDSPEILRKCTTERIVCENEMTSNSLEIIDLTIADNSEESRKLIRHLNNQIDRDLVIQRIQGIDYMLLDEDIECCLKILRLYLPDFEVHEVQFFSYVELIQPSTSNKHLQIIGGFLFEHWICIYYNGQDLYIYDSLNRVELILFAADEIQYLQKRYPSIKQEDYMIMPVTRQPDDTSCGAYAMAFAVEIAFGGDPSTVDYSKDAVAMRRHLSNIIRTQQIDLFPRS
ncbi:hypothetical protein TKK_0001653 [Trichogramma kaykai]